MVCASFRRIFLQTNTVKTILKTNNSRLFISEIIFLKTKDWISKDNLLTGIDKLTNENLITKRILLISHNSTFSKIATYTTSEEKP